MLQVEELSFGYKTKKEDIVLNSPFSTTIPDGQLVCILGSNGSGKSTFLKTITANHRPLQGSIFVENKNLDSFSLKSLAKKMSVVFTDEGLSSNMTVFGLIALGRYPYTGWWGNLKIEDRRIVGDVLEQTRLTKLQDRHIHSLSDGEKQKTMIARAMAQDTSIMILDEPTAHLDIPNKIEVMLLLKKLAHEHQKTIILSTHDLLVASKLADRFLIILPDKTILDGAPEQLILEGAFSKIFDHKEFQFDLADADFKVPFTPTKKVRLTGTEPEVSWTTRALNRNNIGIADSKSTEIAEINIKKHNNGYIWELQVGDQIRPYENLNSLLKHLKAAYKQNT